MEIVNVKNVKRLNEGGTLFDCELLVYGRESYIPYTAKENSEVYNYIVDNNLDILAYEEPTIPVLSLEELKILKIEELNSKVNREYRAYLAKYPEIEVESFKNKANEASLVMENNQIPLASTPYLSKLASNDITTRNDIALAVDTKMTETAQIEAQAVAIRDAIKSCTTLEELEAIKV